MNRRSIVLAFAALLSAAWASAAGAQAGAPSGELSGEPSGEQQGLQSDKKADPRVEAALTNLGIKYTVNSSGNLVVTYGVGEDRSQTVYVMSKTDKYSEVEIREIWSNAGSFEAEPEAEGLADLMTESGKNKIGCWALEKQEDGKYLLFYSIKFPAEVPDEAYRMMLEFASSVTDARELELFQVDEN
jgi:hypothetical protein